MDARLATHPLFLAVTALWLVFGSTDIALSAAGERLLPPTINMVILAGLSTATTCVLIIRAHRLAAARMSQLQATADSLGERLDHRDAALYRDVVRRMDGMNRRLDAMSSWMTRPAIPRGPIRASAAAAAVAVPLEEPTQQMPTLEMQAEVIDLGGRIARRIVDEAK